MHNCETCKGCGGCHPGQLELSAGELTMLQSLGQFGFLPVARKADDMTPIYLEEQDYTKEEYSLILQCLEARGLISLDYRQSLKGADMSAYTGYPVHGSMALTQRGQQALEILETQGIEA